MLVFSGSGISVAAGCQTFSTPGGLYEKAMKRYKLKEGKDLFTYNFYARLPEECNSFLAEVTADLSGKQPTQTHRGILELERSGRLVRQYTLNIDGLDDKAGLTMWSTDSPEGVTVPLHGTAHEVVCKVAGHKAFATEEVRKAMLLKKKPCCLVCGSELRWRIMLYDDKESEIVTPAGVMAMMETDALAADLVLWLGISFEQSASTAYFRHIRSALCRHGKSETPMCVVNPSEDAVFNIWTAVSNPGDLTLYKCLQPSDNLFPKAPGVEPDPAPQLHILTNAAVSEPAPEQEGKRQHGGGARL